MKMRTMIGLAAVGGLLYAHKRRGGEFTVESFRDSGRELLDAIQRGVDKAQREAQDKMREGARQVEHAAHRVADYAGNGSKR
jgi:hypothetical protein